jgi:hypothetical protein
MSTLLEVQFLFDYVNYLDVFIHQYDYPDKCHISLIVLDRGMMSIQIDTDTTSALYPKLQLSTKVLEGTNQQQRSPE